MGGVGGKFEFSSSSSSIRCSTSARGGGKFEFSSSSSSVRVQFEFGFNSNSVPSFFWEEGGSSSSVRVLLGYIFLWGGRGEVRVQFEFEFNSIFYFC